MLFVKHARSVRVRLINLIKINRNNALLHNLP